LKPSVSFVKYTTDKDRAVEQIKYICDKQRTADRNKLGNKSPETFILNKYVVS